MSPAERVRGLMLWSKGWNNSGTRAYRCRLRRLMLARRTSEHACLSLLPTLTRKANLLAPSMQKWPAHRLLPTLSATSYGSNQGGAAGTNVEVRLSLQSMAKLLPTLTRSDGRKGVGESETRLGTPILTTTIGGNLCPTWCEWFLGFPEGWTELAPESQRSATPSSRSAPKSSAT